MGIKVKIVVEPGDKVGELKLLHSPGDGPDDERLITIGSKSVETAEEFELQLSSVLRISVEKVGQVVYDQAQMTTSVEYEGGEPQMASYKSRGAAASGAKESSGETQDPHSTRRSTTHK